MSRTEFRFIGIEFCSEEQEEREKEGVRDMFGTEDKMILTVSAVVEGEVSIWAPNSEGFYTVGFSFIQRCKSQLERIRDFEKANRVSLDTLDHTCPQITLLEEQNGFAFDSANNKVVFSWDQAAKFDFSTFLRVNLRHFPIYFVRKDGEVLAVWQGSFVWLDQLSEKERNQIQTGFACSDRTKRVPETRLVGPVKEVKVEKAVAAFGEFFF